MIYIMKNYLVLLKNTHTYVIWELPVVDIRKSKIKFI